MDKPSEGKGYPYEVPPLLKGPCKGGKSATEAAIERCGCEEAEVYRKALEGIIAYAVNAAQAKWGEEFESGIEAGAEGCADIARSALNSVRPC